MQTVPSIDILPSKAWHDCDEARDLLDSIAANIPPTKSFEGFDPHNRGKRTFTEYTGNRVARLTEIFADYSRAGLSICDKAYTDCKVEGESGDDTYARVKHLYDHFFNNSQVPSVQELIAARLNSELGEAA